MFYGNRGVVVCDVTENSAGKVQASDAVLVNGMAAAFHEHISASPYRPYCAITGSG